MKTAIFKTVMIFVIASLLIYVIRNVSSPSPSRVALVLYQAKNANNESLFVQTYSRASHRDIDQYEKLMRDSVDNAKEKLTKKRVGEAQFAKTW